MPTIYVATTNPGKLRDFAIASRETPCQVLPLPGLADMPAPPEDSPDFAGNARLKALAYARRAPGLIVLADDSGLEVDALDGAPGVHSARYAEDLGFTAGATPDERNNRCLLAALTHTSKPRSGRYRCVLAAARLTHAGHSILATAEGTLAGEILTEPQGDGGFGYDPLFYLPDHGCTMAELDPATRLLLGHRGRALRILLADEHFLRQL